MLWQLLTTDEEVLQEWCKQVEIRLRLRVLCDVEYRSGEQFLL